MAKRINPADPSRAAVAAGREVIRRIREYLAGGETFAIETTLSGGGYLETMSHARERGFLVRLVYVCTMDPEENIQRVRARFAHGGHDVPDDDIRRRYERSLRNLPAGLKIAHEGLVYDNSEVIARVVLKTRNGVIVWRAPDEPDWLKQALAASF